MGSYSYAPSLAPTSVGLNASISGTTLNWYQSSPVVLHTGNPLINFTNWVTQSDVVVDAGSTVPATISAHNIQVDVASVASSMLRADNSIRFTAPSLNLGMNGPGLVRVQAFGQITFDGSSITAQAPGPVNTLISALPLLNVVASQVTFNQRHQRVLDGQRKEHNDGNQEQVAS